MAIIKADGLFGGDRLRDCSELARTWWPWFYTAANGYGRLELNYDRIRREMFGAWEKKAPITKDELRAIFKDYHKNHLAYVYQADGKIWAQFEVLYKPKHYTAEDRRSPEPPADIDRWREQRRLQKEARAVNDLDGWEIVHVIDNKGDGQKRQVRAESGANAAIGIGIGIGIGIDIDKSNGSASASPSEIPEWVPRESWESFVEMRKKIKAPLTARAVTLTINTLAKLRAEGHDPGAVLDQSVMRAWRGVFAIGTSGKGNFRSMEELYPEEFANGS